jgi:hypothetical protein
MTDTQEAIALTMLFKPIGLLLLFGFAYLFRVWVQKGMRDGKLKRLLLRRVND